MKLVKVTYDVLCGINTTVWGGVANAEKMGKFLKTGLSGADIGIGTSHALEDFSSNDPTCGSIDVSRSLSSAVNNNCNRFNYNRLSSRLVLL